MGEILLFGAGGGPKKPAGQGKGPVVSFGQRMGGFKKVLDASAPSQVPVVTLDALSSLFSLPITASLVLLRDMAKTGTRVLASKGGPESKSIENLSWADRSNPAPHALEREEVLCLPDLDTHRDRVVHLPLAAWEQLIAGSQRIVHQSSLSVICPGVTEATLIAFTSRGIRSALFIPFRIQPTPVEEAKGLVFVGFRGVYLIPLLVKEIPRAVLLSQVFNLPFARFIAES